MVSHLTAATWLAEPAVPRALFIAALGGWTLSLWMMRRGDKRR